MLAVVMMKGPRDHANSLGKQQLELTLALVWLRKKIRFMSAQVLSG